MSTLLKKFAADAAARVTLVQVKRRALSTLLKSAGPYDYSPAVPGDLPPMDFGNQEYKPPAPPAFQGRYTPGNIDPNTGGGLVMSGPLKPNIPSAGQFGQLGSQLGSAFGRMYQQQGVAAAQYNQAKSQFNSGLGNPAQNAGNTQPPPEMAGAINNPYPDETSVMGNVLGGHTPPGYDDHGDQLKTPPPAPAPASGPIAGPPNRPQVGHINAPTLNAFNSPQNFGPTADHNLLHRGVMGANSAQALSDNRAAYDFSNSHPGVSQFQAMQQIKNQNAPAYRSEPGWADASTGGRQANPNQAVASRPGSVAPGSGQIYVGDGGGGYNHYSPPAASALARSGSLPGQFTNSASNYQNKQMDTQQPQQASTYGQSSNGGYGSSSSNPYSGHGMSARSTLGMGAPKMPGQAAGSNPAFSQKLSSCLLERVAGSRLLA